MLLCLTTATNIHPAIGALTSLSTHTMPTTHLQRRASNVPAIHLKESQPTTCLFVIIACIHQVHDGSQDLIKTHLSVRWLIQDVWSMTYEWFLKPQSAEELSAFSQLDCKCSTVQRNDVTHQIGRLAWSRSAYKTKQVHARWFMMELELLPAILCYTKELDENDERFIALISFTAVGIGRVLSWTYFLMVTNALSKDFYNGSRSTLTPYSKTGSTRLSASWYMIVIRSWWLHL
jgi:hypothetical protein